MTGPAVTEFLAEILAPLLAEIAPADSARARESAADLAGVLAEQLRIVWIHAEHTTSRIEKLERRLRQLENRVTPGRARDGDATGDDERPQDGRRR